MSSTKQEWAVYALRDPDTNAVRYVGITTDPRSRLQRHLRDARRTHTHRNAWIVSLTRQGLRPVMSVLEMAEDWDSAERAWIKHFRDQGCELVNGNDGGKAGNIGHVSEHRGNYPFYNAAVRGAGQIINDLLKRGEDRIAMLRAIRVKLGQERLKAAAKRHKARGTMDQFEQRIAERMPYLVEL